MNDTMGGIFQISSLKLLGSLQMGLGIFCLLVGAADLFLFLYPSRYNNDTLSALTVAGLPIWCGIWFIVTGSMGCCMSLQQKASLVYFKKIYMALSILCCALFGPALCGIEIYIVMLRMETAKSAHEWLLPLVITFLGINELVCALITSCISCCCSSLNQDKVGVYTPHTDEQEEPEKTRRSTPKLFNVDARKTDKVIPVTSHTANEPKTSKNNGNTQQPTQNNETTDEQDHRVMKPRSRFVEYEDMSDHQNTAKQETEKKQRVSSDSTSSKFDQYKRLKQMILPVQLKDY